MKVFSRHITYDELKRLCKRLRVPLNDEKYREQGWDTVVVGDPQNGYVIYNLFNGRFFGRTPGGINFSSSDTKWSNAQWFRKLLNFFYVE